MDLHDLSNEQLLTDLGGLRKAELENIADIVIYLREVQNRRLDLARGYSSMYEFCRKEMGYRKDEAFSRFCAVRCFILYPAIETDLRENRISMTTLRSAHAAFNRENKARKSAKSPKLSSDEKIAALKQLALESTRSAERILAELFPRAGEDTESTKPIAQDRTLITFAASDQLLANLNTIQDYFSHQNYDRNWEKTFELMAHEVCARIEKERTKPVRENKRAASEQASQTTEPRSRKSTPTSRKSKTQTREPRKSEPQTTNPQTTDPQKPSVPCEPAALGHPTRENIPVKFQQVSEYEYQQVMVFEASLLEKQSPSDHQSAPPQQPLLPQPKESKNSRYWSAENKRMIADRSEYRCEYVDPVTNRRCESRHAVEQDEIRPIALGGTSEFSNIRYLCRAHNTYASWKLGLTWKGAEKR